MFGINVNIRETKLLGTKPGIARLNVGCHAHSLFKMSQIGYSRQSGGRKAKLGVSTYDGSASIINTEKREAERIAKEQSDQSLAAIAKQQERALRATHRDAKRALKSEEKRVQLKEQRRLAAEADPPTELQLRSMARRRAIAKALKS